MITKWPRVLSPCSKFKSLKTKNQNRALEPKFNYLLIVGLSGCPNAY